MTIIEAIGLALSAIQLISPSSTPRAEAEARVVAAHDAAVAELMSTHATFSSIQPIDASFLARSSNWQSIIEEALCIRQDTLTAGQLDLSRFDERPNDTPEHAEAYLASFRTAISTDLSLSTLRAATQAARTAEKIAAYVTPARTEALDALMRDSHQRMTARCIAAGVESAEAPAFASMLASFHAEAASDIVSSHALKIITGALGAGKSTLAESVLQQAVNLAQEDATVAPVWLDAVSLTASPLHEQVRHHTKDFPEHEPSGLIIIVDGLDELDFPRAERLVNEARALTAIDRCTCVLTTRPLPLRLEEGEGMGIKRLAPTETSTLVSRAAKREVKSWEMSAWHSSIREATQLPIFALLTGLWLRENPTAPATTGELVEHLIRRSLPGNQGRHSDATEWLMRLAVITTASGRPVAARDLPHTGDITALTESGLVEQRDEGVGFVLALLQEWFAAKAMLQGVVSTDTLVSQPRHLSRWRGALRVLLEIAPTEFVHELLTNLVPVDPGLIGELVAEAASPLAARGCPLLLPDAITAGSLVRDAMVGFRDALGDLGSLLAPLAPDGMVQSLGVRTMESRLELAWLAERPSDGDVIETLAGDINWDGSPSRYRWTRLHTIQPARTAAWPWRLAHEQLCDRLSGLLTAGVPIPDANEVMKEAVWTCANIVLGRGAPRDSIQLNALTDRIEALFGDIVGCRLEDIGFAGAPKGLEKPLSILLPAIAELRAAGHHELVPPWPMPDVKPTGNGGSAWVWDFYSSEQLRRRIEHVYGTALNSYESLALGVFQPLAPHFRQWTLAPIELRFYLRFPEVEGWGSHPVGTWHVVPLPEGEDSRACVEIVDDEPTAEELWAASEAARQIRPDLAEATASSVVHTLVDVWGKRPATQLCYGWLIDDLAAIRWCSRGNPRFD